MPQAKNQSASLIFSILFTFAINGPYSGWAAKWLCNAKSFCLAVFIVFFLQASSQNQRVSEEIRFISYLIDNSEYRDAIFVAGRIANSSENFSPGQADSLNFYSGWCFYSIKKLDSSAYFFDKVSRESSFFFAAKFYQAFEYIYLGKLDSAEKVLTGIDFFSDSTLTKLQVFELSGIALLKRNYDEFQSLSARFDSGYYPVAAEQENFFRYLNDLKSVKNKSAFLAGLLSAVLPGSGKFYAGYRGQAIASFLPVTMLGAVALESFLKAGLTSPQFIVFGAVFSVFYLGNIWGGALSVKTMKDEKFYETDQNILNDLHLPLRRVFN